MGSRPPRASRRLVVGGVDDSGYPSGSAELFDPASGTWSWTDSLVGLGLCNHTATLLANGQALVAGGYSGSVSAGAYVYEYANGTCTTTGALNIARDQHTTTLLTNNEVLVAGGDGTTTQITTAELYEPAGGAWTTTGPLSTVTYSHTATLLSSGRVLVAGGYNGQTYLARAELYDPPSGTWSTTGSLSQIRCWHTATLLPNGKVLVAGGWNGGFLAGAELYDPATGTWTTTASLHTARFVHTATLLPNGKILAAGGMNSSAELYDPAGGTWATTGSLANSRGWHTATLLPNGKVLVVGGANGPDGLASAELYDPASGTWTTTGSLNTARYAHTATLLPNGKVLVAGGASGLDALASVELYDPASGTWTTTAALNTARRDHTATLLPNGKVLIVGGDSGLSNNPSYLAGAELYDVGLGFNAAWQPQIAAFSSPIFTNGWLQLTGSGFRGVSEGSGGNGSQDSAAGYPLVQLRRLDNEQIAFLACTNWSATSFASAPVSGLPAGWAMATVFVNGIPSQSSLLLWQPSSVVTMPPILITNAIRLSGGSYRFSFANTPGLGFTVMAATNPALSMSGWTNLGGATEVSAGQYQFTDPQASTTPRRFYRVRSP